MNDFPTADAVTYCTSDEVFKVLQQAPASAHAEIGELDKTDVEEFILEAQDKIDKATGQAWRLRTVTQEYLNVDTDLINREGFALIELDHIHIQTLSSGAGDSLEVWEGNGFTDWLATRTEGRDGDYYIVEDKGELYVRLGTFGVTTHTIIGDPRNRVRITYRYGLTTVPKDIQRATRLLAAVILVQGFVLGEQGEGTGLNQISLESRSQTWERQAWSIINRYRIARSGS